MLFILIYAITGWKIKKQNRHLELWKIWKRSAWMETAVQLCYVVFYDTKLSFSNQQLSIQMLFVVFLMALLRFSALIMLYKGWKRFPVK